jgi:hypothetical protein
MTTTRDLLTMSGAEIDALFTASPAGAPPTGLGVGQALAATGSPFSRPFAAAARLVAWQGKQFSADGTSLRNLITPFGIRAIEAAVYVQDSWLDGRPCVVLDYSKTSTVAKWVRDEIRELSPGLYLGLVYVRSKRAPLRFSLSFSTSPPSSTTSHGEPADLASRR